LTVKGVLYFDFIGELTQSDWIMDRGGAGCPAALLSTIVVCRRMKNSAPEFTPLLGSFFVLIVYYQCVMRMGLSIYLYPYKMLMSLQVYEGNGVILIHLSLEPQMN